MRRFIQWLDKVPTPVLIIIIFAFPFLRLSLNIEVNSPAAFTLSLPIVLSSILLIIRFMNYLKAKGSGFYHFFRLFFGYMLICFPAALFITVDLNQGLKGFLMIPGLALEAGLLIWLLVRHFKKQWKKEHSSIEETSSSYSFENLCDDLSAGREIEFTYDNSRYLFIPEKGRYYFKHIVSIDPYEYEILAEAGNALVCIDAAAVNGKKMTGLWPDIEDITIY